ncbi:MAG TPA: endopeptidase La [Polyangiaceae bacterium]|nr:endopeptidase La [Polyangiaceae bacterium]
MTHPRDANQDPVSDPSCAFATPDALPVLPLRETVVFPLTIAPVSIDQGRSRTLLDDAKKGDRLVALVAIRESDSRPPRPQDLYAFATAAIVHDALRGPDNALRVAVQGLQRVRIVGWVQTEPYLVARVRWLPDAIEHGVELDALVLSARRLFLRFVSLVAEPSSDLASTVDRVTDPRQLVYLLASTAPMSTEARQQILEQPSVLAKLRRLIDHLQHEIAVRELMHRIANETTGNGASRPPPAPPRPQAEEPAPIELAEAESEASEARELRGAVGRLPLPREARKEIDRELDRLERTPATSPEHGMIRTYLEWVLKLPWGKATGRPIDVAHARAVLDADHHELLKVKDRIIEYLAVRHLRAERGVDSTGDGAGAREPILCLVGPPGVGKTSLGQSIARALGRRFARMALGGIHDEAEIRGHRRTYVGAMPGRILQALSRCGAVDAVFMLDEIDKLGVGFHGDPSAALLEVLDPAQNHAFVDSYLGVPFDLSRVLLICTANSADTIPPPLLDRMELIPVTGYTDGEKLSIAQRHLLPKAIAAHGLRPDEVAFEDAAIRQIVRGYTREAGVRNLGRELAGVLRKVARTVSEGTGSPVLVSAEGVRDYLGTPHHYDEVAERIDRPGVTTGLAWMQGGGDILFVEATIVASGDDRLVLTGMLGNVMRESAQAALSYLRSNAERVGVDPGALERKTVHVHVPAGSIPKDGPSAGVTILTAIASQATGRVARSDLGMTGEITLRGRVLPVGGIKEKVLAARRAGLRVVVLPRRSEPQLEDVPDEVKAEMRFILVESVDEVLAAALGIGV